MPVQVFLGGMLPLEGDSSRTVGRFERDAGNSGEPKRRRSRSETRRAFVNTLLVALKQTSSWLALGITLLPTAAVFKNCGLTRSNHDFS
jgi:hypothetical protein